METPEAGEGVQVLNACGWSGSPEVRMALTTGPRDRALITVSARTQLRKARGMVLLICMKNLSDFTQFPSGDPWIPWQGPLSSAALPLLGSHLHLGIRASKLIFFLVSCHAQVSTNGTNVIETHLISPGSLLSSSRVNPNRIFPGVEPIHQIFPLFRALSPVFLLSFTMALGNIPVPLLLSFALWLWHNWFQKQRTDQGQPSNLLGDLLHFKLH